MTLPLFSEGSSSAPAVLPARRIKARVTMVLKAAGRDFFSQPTDRLDLGFDGIDGDFHAGFTRRSGGREPWYRRDTEMRNERQVSLVAPDDLAMAAQAMGIDRIEPGWIGANLVIDGVALLSMLPPRTLMFFAGGVTLKVDGQNAPCRLSGSAIATHFPDRDATDLALSFKDAARRRRGLVAWVEKPGSIHLGETVNLHLPEQWIYR